MAVVRMLGGTGGRVARAALGLGLLAVGASLGGPWWVLAAVGLVPLGAALGNVCLIAPIFGQPLRPAAR